jgi:hypothetical protein
MSNQEILIKAITKALANGWKSNWISSRLLPIEIPPRLTDELIHTHQVEKLIYRHDFAKSLWSDKEITVESGENIPLYSKRLSLQQRVVAWKHHLQMMVVADDPLKYLGAHLDD